MTDNPFKAILTKVISERGISILDNPAKCNGILQDYANGGYKREIRLLLQALEAGAYKELFQSDDPDIGIQKMIRKLQDEYAIAKNAAEDTVMMLADFSKNREMTDDERIAHLEKLSQEAGNYDAQYELGLLYEKQEKYKEANYWYKNILKALMPLAPSIKEAAVPSTKTKGSNNPEMAKEENIEEDINFSSFVWICGRCNTANEKKLLHCQKCGKQFFIANTSKSKL